jgi:hypothetical protein
MDRPPRRSVEYCPIVRAAPQAVDRQEADRLQHGSEAESLFGVEGPVSMISLTTPLFGPEITELNVWTSPHLMDF